MAGNPIGRMKQLIAEIKQADEAYFGSDAPELTDLEYDTLMEELAELEATTGIVFSDSPTKRVGGSVKAELPSVKHTKPMLSANKTKSIYDVASFIGTQSAIISWKMDGLSLILRYENGAFRQALTRGSDGLTGEDVTRAVSYFRNVPHKVPCKDRFEVRGEGVISWEDFKTLTKLDISVSHPRNLAAASVRSVTADPGKCSHLDFFAFELITDSPNAPKYKQAQLEYLTSLGFATVDWRLIPACIGFENIRAVVERFRPEAYAYPVDGLIIEYDNLAYGMSLGATAHHENNKIALKWKDELHETTFRGVDLVTTRTGVVSLVAQFDPVCIDGAMIRRADLHNFDVFESFRFGIGDTIQIYKANQIIPQVAKNLTRSGTYRLPDVCPCCGEKLKLRISASGAKNLFCQNAECLSRNTQRLSRFCDKSAMNIRGLSTATLGRLMELGWVRSYADLYHLVDHREEMQNVCALGLSSTEALLSEIEKSRSCSLGQFLLGVGVPHVGPSAAAILDQYYYGAWEPFEAALNQHFAFSHIDGISYSVEQSLHSWYTDPAEEKLWRPLLSELRFEDHRNQSVVPDTFVTSPIQELFSRYQPVSDAATLASTGALPSGFSGKNVVITGTLSNMTRKEAFQRLRLRGANVCDSVSGRTDYLVVASMPGRKKLNAARANGTTILTEQQFTQMLESA